MMAGKDAKSTISALLSTAPPPAPVDEPAPKPRRERERPAVVPAPAAPTDDGEEWEEDELERFDFDPSEPLVKRRKRKAPSYQTLRVSKTTAQIMRQAWIAARRQDELITFTEFATLTCQHGLRALKEQRERGRGESNA